MDDFIPKIKDWGQSIRKINNFNELQTEWKSIRNKVNNLVKSYLEEYEELIDEDKYCELDEYSDELFDKTIDKYYDKVNKNLPLVAIRHPINNRIIKRAYTNDEVIQSMKEAVDKARAGHEELRLHNWKQQEEAEYISKLHDNMDKHKRYIKSL